MHERMSTDHEAGVELVSFPTENPMDSDAYLALAGCYCEVIDVRHWQIRGPVGVMNSLLESEPRRFYIIEKNFEGSDACDDLQLI